MEYRDSPRGRGKGKRGLISKTWERCKSFSGGMARKGGNSNGTALTVKSKSWPRNLIFDFPNQGKFNERKSYKVAPDGCFSIYVGSEKQRFVIRTEYVNHPLFRTLLEEAETEYGFSSDGPLVLPCEVEHFIQVLVEMDREGTIEKSHGCNFVTRSHTQYHILTPPRLVPHQ
ncbi:auxin-responsive protein SAUR32-like [Primulina eburnea]|uniref:auxin-responsive protein SAUR32-like n=1 Tax=Primulina eburnea TaxID=1245227 RepID=UPI003C6CB33C